MPRAHRADTEGDGPETALFWNVPVLRATSVSAVSPSSAEAVGEASLETKRLRRLERTLDSRPLDAWERYRGLLDVTEEYRDLLDSADKKTRFALIIMGLLNAVNFLLIARSDVFGRGTATQLGRGLVAYAVVYAFLSLYFFSQTIEALRPRGARYFSGPAGPGDFAGAPRLRAMAHVATQPAEAFYGLWETAQVGHLSREVAFQAQALARINVVKYRALERVYRGLVALTALTAALVTLLAYRGLAG